MQSKIISIQINPDIKIKKNKIKFDKTICHDSKDHNQQIMGS